MNRSTFFKSAIAAIAVFFGFKKAEANPWSSRMPKVSPDDGQWIKMYRSTDSGLTWAPEGTSDVNLIRVNEERAYLILKQDDKTVVEQITYDKNGNVISMRNFDDMPEDCIEKDWQGRMSQESWNKAHEEHIEMKRLAKENMKLWHSDELPGMMTRRDVDGKIIRF